MSHEGSPGTEAGSLPVAGPDFKALLKDSLAEVLRENPQLLRPAPADPPPPSVPGGGSGKYTAYYVLGGVY